MTLVLDPTTLSPAITGWLGAHVAFRRDADALVAAVNAVEPSDYIGAGRLADASVSYTHLTLPTILRV